MEFLPNQGNLHFHNGKIITMPCNSWDTITISCLSGDIIMILWVSGIVSPETHNIIHSGGYYYDVMCFGGYYYDAL